MRRVPVARTAVALRLALLRGALRGGSGSTARQVGLVVSGVLGTLLAAGAVLLLTLTRGRGELPVDLCTALYTSLLVGWVVVPLLTFTSDDLLDPTRLALLPLDQRQLLTVLGVGALVGVGPVATAVAALGLVTATATGPGSFLVALLAAALLVLLCVVASRAVAAALSGVLRSRRGRDLGVALSTLVVAGIQVGNLLLQRLVRHDEAADVLGGFGAALRFTPVGLLAAAPTRSPVPAVGSLLAVAALVAALGVLWARSTRRALERPDASAGRRRRSSPLAPRLLAPLLPSGRAGAVAAKDLRYLVRDPRRLTALATAVVVPLVAVAGPVLVRRDSSVGPALVYAVCPGALLLGLGGANRFGLDGTALWQLVASATDRRDARRDLLGGDLALVLTGAPLLAAVAVVLAAVTGARHLPAALGLALGVLALGAGLSGLVAVLAPYPVPERGNAFGGSGGPGRGCLVGLLALAAVLLTAALCLPLLALLLPARSSPGYGFALLVVGPAYGVLVGAGLREVAARRWARRGPDVLQVMVSERS